MKKAIALFAAIVLTISASTPVLAQKVSNTENSSKGEIVQKKEYAKELASNGTINKINNKIAKYYKDNKDSLVDLSLLKEPDSPEAKEVLNKIEKDMNDHNKQKSEESPEIGTEDFSSDPSTGSNDISYSLFEDGDIVLVHDGFCVYGYYRHTGTYDEGYGNFISAQLNDVGNGDGVIRESKSWYQGYDEAVGIAVDYYEDDRYYVLEDVVDFLRNQLGEPYSLTPGYNVWDKWYCSKLPWVGWKESSGVDISYIDYLIGMCIPDDIYYDSDTFVFASGD